MAVPCFGHLERELEEVTQYISSSLAVRSPFIAKLAEHFLSTLGQRIRPSLLLTFSRIGRRETPAGAPALAAMVELVHSASLLHDDVIDKGRVRRNRLTVNAKWGNKEAVLLGDLLLSRSLGVLVENNDSRIVDALYRITAALSEGQLVELANFGNRALDEKDYLRIIELKTAVFFAESCFIGAVASGAGERETELARQFGLEMGFAYQILDDLLDVTSNLEALGKDIQNDLLHGKMTLPFIHCARTVEGREMLGMLSRGTPGNGGAGERPSGGGAVEGGRMPPPHEVAALVRRSGAFDTCIASARKYADAALEAAERIGDAGVQRTLRDFLEYMFDRASRFSGASREAGGGAVSPTAVV